jgi:dimethylaniline monooxygenase (N-oxide forming)
VSDYLDPFSQSKKFGGKTVKERIRFSSKATQISKEGSEWKIEVTNGTLYTCQKLMMATGLTSTPDIPSLLCHGKCKPLIIHSKYLAKKSQFFPSPQIKNVVVLGGSKSAFDAVYMLSQAGKSVSWIIRTMGHGPANMVPPDVPFLRNSHEPQSMKIIGKMSPSIFEPVDGWVRFFHQSTIGGWINKGIWNTLDWMWQRAGGYSRNENLEKLRPDRPAFWTSDGIGVSNSPDLWDMLSKAKIYRNEIDRLEEGRVILSSGEMVECDAIVACTGWNACYPMFSTTQAQAMGLPLPLIDTCESDTAKWEALITQADEKVLQRFPRLSETPSYPERKPTISSHCLYRGIIPTTSTDHSIVFLGQYGTSQSLLIGEIQSLWAVAYLMDQLPLPGRNEMEEDVALVLAWRRRRYLAHGRTFLYDQIPVSPPQLSLARPQAW